MTPLRFVRLLALLTAATAVLAALPVEAAALLPRPDGAWGERVDIPFDPAHSTNTATLVGDGQGGAMALAFQGWNYSGDLYASFYSEERGWGDAALLESSGINGWSAAVGALAASGAAVAAWVKGPTATPVMEAALYAPASGWTAPHPFATSPDSIVAGAAAIDAAGTAAVVWSDNTSGRYEGYYSLHPAGGAWSAPAVLGGTSANGSRGWTVSAWPAGGFVAFWSETVLSGFGTLRAAWYGEAGGWSAPVNVSQNASVYVIQPKVATAPDGTLFVTWTQFDDVYNAELLVRRYTPAGGFDAVESVETSFPYQTPSVAVDAGGNATIAWMRAELNIPIMARRYVPGQGWGADVRLAEASWGPATPALVAGDNGTALVVVSRADTVGNYLAFVHFAPSVGWSRVTYIDGTVEQAAPLAIPLRGDEALLLADGGFPASFRFTRFDHLPPAVAITAPGEGTATAQGAAVVVGTAEVGANVLVGGVEAAVDANGSWRAQVPLLPGINRITARATDAAGNTATVSVNVTYNDPVPALEAQLSASEADRARVEEGLNATRGELAAARTDLNTTRTDLNATRADLTSTQAALSAAQAAQASLQAQVNQMNGTITQTPQPAASDPLPLLLAVAALALAAVGLVVTLARRPRPPEKPA